MIREQTYNAKRPDEIAVSKLDNLFNICRKEGKAWSNAMILIQRNWNFKGSTEILTYKVAVKYLQIILYSDIY